MDEYIINVTQSAYEDLAGIASYIKDTLKRAYARNPIAARRSAVPLASRSLCGARRPKPSRLVT
jgi:hypothetical protein